MDLDSYIARHAGQWDRLTELTQRRGRITGAEADEVIDLYQRTSTHLSTVRAAGADPVLESRLSALVAGARSVITGTRVPVLATVGYFFTAGFPAAVYRARYWWIITAVVSTLVSVLIAWRVINEPGLINTLADPEQLRRLVDHDFAAYYSENPAADFGFQVWINNARVAALCLITGVLGFPVLILLWLNQANVGLLAGVMIGAGRADVFFGLLLPHGLLELTVVWVAAGAGLRLCWSWIAPGPRTRAQALGQEGRTAGALALGLAVCLMISGAIEAFVTPSTLPVWARLGIGVLAWSAFLTYVFVLGRRAARAGETGDVDHLELADSAPSQAV